MRPVALNVGEKLKFAKVAFTADAPEIAAPKIVTLASLLIVMSAVVVVKFCVPLLDLVISASIVKVRVSGTVIACDVFVPVNVSTLGDAAVKVTPPPIPTRRYPIPMLYAGLTPSLVLKFIPLRTNMPVASSAAPSLIVAPRALPLFLHC